MLSNRAQSEKLISVVPTFVEAVAKICLILWKNVASGFY